jgi:hypothetical protein
MQEKELDKILEIISNDSAMSFAERIMQLESQEKNYEAKMRTMWGNDTEPLENCIERSKISYLRRYAEAVKLYTGFLQNGKVFVLDKEYKQIFFLHKSDKHVAGLYNHYNPLNVDCIETGISAKYFSGGVENGRYDVSQSDDDLIEELEALMKFKHVD